MTLYYLRNFVIEYENDSFLETERVMNKVFEEQKFERNFCWRQFGSLSLKLSLKLKVDVNIELRLVLSLKLLIFFLLVLCFCIDCKSNLDDDEFCRQMKNLCKDCLNQKMSSF